MSVLYKKDSKGKIRVLHITVEGDELVQKSGLLDGALVEARKKCTSKNVGKINETTPEQQAEFEAKSKVFEKLKEDYFETVDEAMNIQVILPMLAKDYKLLGKKIKWGTDDVYGQPKLDGMRALGTTGPNATLTSRDGGNITTCPHIISALQQIPAGHTLDGELYAHGESFQENMRLIKKNRGADTEKVKFNIYDVVKPTWSFKNRYETSIFENIPHLVKVQTVFLTSEEDLKSYHGINIATGYEGTMVRWGEEGYKLNGRSENLLKYKDFKDISLPIKDIEPASARPTWGVPVFHWPGAPNDELRAGLKFSHKDREEFLANKQAYIGKTAELRFFEYSETGVPRFPVMVGIRLDK